MPKFLTDRQILLLSQCVSPSLMTQQRSSWRCYLARQPSNREMEALLQLRAIVLRADTRNYTTNTETNEITLHCRVLITKRGRWLLEQSKQ